ncbi:MAG TPA: WhiB family transcriptional regulator [Acidimicrobiia bacterium]|nr:WhiB family transcriptional regulator [Acidimicrobiia bacterium]
MARSPVLPTRVDWMEEAACRAIDTDIFFPSSDADAAAAKAVCATCPVREACLEHALETRPAPEGIWGGLTHIERHRVIRRRQKAARKQRKTEAA